MYIKIIYYIIKFALIISIDKICIVIVIVIFIGGVLSSHPGTYMMFSLITTYGSNVHSKPLSC